jgi:hypothetical protein
MPAGLEWHLQRSKERAGKALSNMSKRALLVPGLARTTEQTAQNAGLPAVSCGGVAPAEDEERAGKSARRIKAYYAVQW